MELNEKVIKAFKKYLMLKDYDIIDTDGDLIIAMDNEDDCIAFIDTEYKVLDDESQNIFGWCKRTKKKWRKEMENKSMRHLLKMDGKYFDHAYRFDMISMAILGNDRAAIRHHVAVSLGDDSI